MEINRIYNMDCLDGMKEIKDKSVSMVLTDIPYGECSGFVMGGFRQINKDKADYVDFSISDMANELIRVCSGSIYLFCGTTQFSEIIKTFRNGGMTCRICVWEKTNPSPMNGQHLWLSSVECCVFGRFQKRPLMSTANHLYGVILAVRQKFTQRRSLLNFSNV